MTRVPELQDCLLCLFAVAFTLACGGPPAGERAAAPAASRASEDKAHQNIHPM